MPDYEWTNKHRKKDFIMWGQISLRPCPSKGSIVLIKHYGTGDCVIRK